MEEKYLSEERYQRNNDKVKTVGKIVLIIGIIGLVLGIIFIILGFVGIGSTINNGINAVDGTFSSSDSQKTVTDAFGSIGLFALGGGLSSTGFFLMMIGSIIILIAHRREITAYTTQQTMPVAQETIEKMAPTIGDAAGEIAKGIKKGLNEADKE